MRIIETNSWAKTVTEAEVASWVSAMLETGRTESAGYWTDNKLVRCPFGKPLAYVFPR